MPKSEGEPSKDSQRRTPQNKKAAPTHGSEIKPLTPVERRRAKSQEQREQEREAGQLGLFDSFRAQETYVQPFLPNFLHQVGSLVTKIRNLDVGSKRQRIAYGAA